MVGTAFIVMEFVQVCSSDMHTCPMLHVYLSDQLSHVPHSFIQWQCVSVHSYYNALHILHTTKSPSHIHPSHPTSHHISLSLWHTESIYIRTYCMCLTEIDLRIHVMTSYVFPIVCYNAYIIIMHIIYYSLGNAFNQSVFWCFQVQGDTYGSASEVPSRVRSLQLICTAAVKAMAKVHRRFWGAGEQKEQDRLSRDFWTKQVCYWYIIAAKLSHLKLPLVYVFKLSFS